jgi:membrane protease YdiL (CAAX protease family)
LAWLLHDVLSGGATGAGWNANTDTLYWIAAKLLIWALPAWYLARRRGFRMDEDLGFRPGLGPQLAMGAGIGVGLVVASAAMEVVLGGFAFVLPVPDLSLLNGVLVTPLVEEFVIRGYGMAELTRLRAASLAGSAPSLTRNWTDGDVNLIGALAFLAMHLPGWYFQGRMRAPFSLIQPAVFVLLFGLLLGWLRQRTESLWVPIVVHVLNNVYGSVRG